MLTEIVTIGFPMDHSKFQASSNEEENGHETVDPKVLLSWYSLN